MSLFAGIAGEFPLDPGLETFKIVLSPGFPALLPLPLLNSEAPRRESLALKRRNACAAAMAAVGLVIATLASAGSATSAQAIASPAGPAIKLIAAQHNITAPRFGNQVFVDPGIWVASLGAPLQFDVGRASYTNPLTITQIINEPGLPPQARPLPASVLDGWNGLKNFITLTVRNKTGKVVASSHFTLCPNSGDPERASLDSPGTSPYPQQCAAVDPFQTGMVWGIERGWAVDPVQFGRAYSLALGTYRVTESIAPVYGRLFGIPAADATATVAMTVVKGNPCCLARPGRQRPAAALPSLPAVPSMTNPPESALPDLVPLPAWGIRPAHIAGRDLLSFSATVWVGGNGPLDVQGFRVSSSFVMSAYQYFWQDGHVIGRAPAGTMGFDSQPGHNHWHFQQFAAYRLLGRSGKLALRSQKTGFCIAPTDPVDLLLPTAVWQPSFVGLSGQCGTPTALWVREMMPVGWGDTYTQFLAGQAFDITNLPNGTYYIQVIANPGHVLRETTTANDAALRRVIISGTRGHRHVKVPAWNGIDPEP